MCLVREREGKEETIWVTIASVDTCVCRLGDTERERERELEGVDAVDVLESLLEREMFGGVIDDSPHRYGSHLNDSSSLFRY